MGCGGDDPAADRASTPSPAPTATSRPDAEPLGEALGGSVAALADCAAWRGGPRARQLATVADIRNQVSRDDTGVEAPPLSDAEALALFDRACARPGSDGFRLYVLYARAAGFGPLARQLEPGT